jgi:hypothetical protein
MTPLAAIAARPKECSMIQTPPSRHGSRRMAGAAALIALTLLAGGSASAADTSAAQQFERWSSQAGAPGRSERGRVFFTTRHGGEWACASCHGDPPVAVGKHASTGKAIDAMAPAVNADRFTSTAKVDKWFRRNCKDVLSRECSAAEKADVLAYLISLKP